MRTQNFLTQRIIRILQRPRADWTSHFYIYRLLQDDRGLAMRTRDVLPKRIRRKFNPPTASSTGDFHKAHISRLPRFSGRCCPCYSDQVTAGKRQLEFGSDDN